MGAVYSSVTEYSFDNVTTTDLVYNVAADDTLVVLVVAAKLYDLTTTTFPYRDELTVTGVDDTSPYSDTSWSPGDNASVSGIPLVNRTALDVLHDQMPLGSGNRNYLSLGLWGKYYGAAAVGESVTISTTALPFEGAAHIIAITGVKRLQRSGKPQTEAVGGTYRGSPGDSSTLYQGTSVIWSDFAASGAPTYNRIIRRAGQLRLAMAAYQDATLAIIGDPTGFTAIADTVSRASSAGLGLQTWYSTPVVDPAYGVSFTPVPAVTVTDRYYCTGHMATYGADTTGGTLLGHVA